MVLARSRLDDESFENGQLLRFANPLFSDADMERCVVLVQLPDFLWCCADQCEVEMHWCATEVDPLRAAPWSCR